MKVKTNQFRTIIKESIKELIEEGAFKDVVKECVSEMMTEGTLSMNPVLSNIEDIEHKERMLRGLAQEKRAQELARVAARGDLKSTKLYEEIFSDTAKHTMMSQLAADGNREAAENIAPEYAMQDAAQLNAFGSAVNRWATVAFMKKQ